MSDINNNGLSMRTNVTKGTNPSAMQWLTAIRMFQAGSGIANTDRVGGIIEASIDTSGVTKQRMGAYQYTAGSADYNAIDAIIDKNGNKSYAVSNPDAFREAIGAPNNERFGNMMVYESSSNSTSFTITLPTLSNRFHYGLVIGQIGSGTNKGFVYLLFIGADSTQVTLTPVYVGSGFTGITASRNNNVLTFSSTETVWGGIRVLWLN